MSIDHGSPSIKKLLIANRGEIAVRVARTCRDLNIRSVSVFSDQDKDSPHVGMSDEAYALEGRNTAETYLNITALLEVAERCGADAIHPGYGFLSENPDFAEETLARGLTWLGPSPSCIRTLGDKLQARELARKVKVPMAPGTLEPVRDATQVRSFAKKNGLPIIIKAAYGGGGRGMRVVGTEQEIDDAYESAVREATRAFGRGECFVEKLLVRPRHVETQCLADSHGTVVVVSTRDCSVQRRNQKLVEEAPAPFLTDEQVENLRGYSKRILAEGGYVGAGTCEFLIDEHGRISFLEVNTRLQVEHPVSEQVTGLDLVAEQIRIAEGGKLDPRDPPAIGHSIEFRINAEDPANEFSPSLGTLIRYREPSGPGVRIDSGVEQGTIIGGSFDSLLSKLVITGSDRDHALRRARRALDEYEIDGVATVLPFHRSVVNQNAFIAVNNDFRVHTKWLEDEYNDDLPRQSGGDEPSNFMDIPRFSIELDGRRHSLRLQPELLRSLFSFLESSNDSGTLARPPIRRSSANKFREELSSASDALVTAPMSGTVTRIEVEPGSVIGAGQILVVLEAMKMEQPVKARMSGVVGRVTCSMGQNITSGASLVELK